jgi:putative FmdB family regulatory protein
MPLYVYKCTKCSQEVEVLRSMSQREAPLACKGCGGECRPLLTTPHWNWGTDAAAHGNFIEESRGGHHGIVPKTKTTGTREDLVKR